MVPFVPPIPGRGRLKRQYRRVEARVGGVDLTPRRIALLYLVLGMLALYLSDVLLLRYLSDPLLGRVQAIKGGVEVLLTAGLVFVLTRRSQRQLRAVNERLEQRNDELRLLHRVYRHNLRNELTVLKLCGERLRAELPGEAAASACDRLLATTDRLRDHVEQIRRIRKVTRSADRRRAIDLTRVVPRILRSHPLVTDAVEVTTDLPESIDVRVNPMFRAAISEVVTNAIEHNDAESPSVTVEVDPHGGPPGTADLVIADDGSGIPDLERPALDPDAESPLSHPAGMGLWFVEWVVSHSDGDLAITSSGEGTAVRLRIPKAAAPAGRPDPDAGPPAPGGRSRRT